LEKEDLITEEVRLENSLKHKSFLILIKYVFHILGLSYIVHTTLQFIGIDIVQFGCFFHVALIPWIIFMAISSIFRFCYVHRLPLYYIALNEILVVTDNYYTIPLDDFNLAVVHLIIIGIVLLGYSYYYIKYKL
jgi:hypothetical protein